MIIGILLIGVAKVIQIKYITSSEIYYNTAKDQTVIVLEANTLKTKKAHTYAKVKSYIRNILEKINIKKANDFTHNETDLDNKVIISKNLNSSEIWSYKSKVLVRTIEKKITQSKKDNNTN